jgi:hypothetical protein
VSGNGKSVLTEQDYEELCGLLRDDKYTDLERENSVLKERIETLEKELYQTKILVAESVSNREVKRLERQEKESGNALPLPSGILAKGLKLKKLKRLSDKFKTKTELFNEQIKVLKEVLAQQMINSNIPSFTFNGNQYSLGKDFFLSTPKGNKEIVIQLLKENNYGDIIKEDYNASTLKSIVKELYEDNEEQLPHWLIKDGEPLVTLYTPNSVDIRKASGKSQQKLEKAKKSMIENAG